MVEGGMSYRAVARRMGCNHTPVMRLMEHCNTTGSINDIQHPVCERVISILCWHTYMTTSKHVSMAQETMGQYNLHISASTVQRHLCQHDIHSHKAYRGAVLMPEYQNHINWCRQHLRWPQQCWHSVLFTDDSRFCIDMPDRCQRVWHRRSKHYMNFTSGRLHVGAAVVWWYGERFLGGTRCPWLLLMEIWQLVATLMRYWNQPLHFSYETTLTLHYFSKTTHPHSARLTMDYLTQHNIDILSWPSFLPVLSPIEHLWDQIGCSLYSRRQRPGNHQQLIQAITDNWNAIPQNQIQCLICSMQHQCRVTLDTNGGHTQY